MGTKPYPITKNHGRQIELKSTISMIEILSFKGHLKNSDRSEFGHYWN